MAAELRASSPTDDEFAQAIHALILSRVRFEREAQEEFQTGAFTLARGAGDCDDHFRLAYGLATAGGLPSALVVLHRGAEAPADAQGPAHAVAAFLLGGGWVFAETTVAAELGENPNAAAVRLGLTSARSDIAKEVTIMTEKDLAPLPEHFRDRNDPAQIRRDAAALQRLGFLSRAAPVAAMGDAADPTFRRAVAEYQRGRGLVVDGLIGPTTRLTIARELGADGATTIGDPVGAPVTVVHHSADVPDSFLHAVHAFSARMRKRGATARAVDWLMVWNAESGVSNVANRAGHPYYGLNQMGLAEQKAVGFRGTSDDWLELSLADQLAPYVERFYVGNAAAFGGGAGSACYRDVGSIYLANLAPAHLKHANEPGFVLYAAPSAAYRANASAFDTERKGSIMVRDLVPFVSRQAANARWRELQARSKAIAFEPPPSSGGIARLAGVAVFLASAAGLTYWVVRS